MRGLLIEDDWQPKDHGRIEMLCFICPHCHQEHSIFVSKTETFEYEGIPVWHYIFKNHDTNVIILNPSFDASDVCGYHGPSTWECEIHLIPNGKLRTPADEDWLYQ